MNHEYSNKSSAANVEAEESDEEKKIDPREKELATLKPETLIVDNRKKFESQLKFASITAEQKKGDKTYLQREHKRILDDIPDYFVHEVDFGKVNHNAVYEFAGTLASRNQIAGI